MKHKPEDWKVTRIPTATPIADAFMALIEDAPEDAFLILVVAQPIAATTPATVRVHWKIAANADREIVPAILFDAAEFFADPDRPRPA